MARALLSVCHAEAQKDDSSRDNRNILVGQLFPELCRRIEYFGIEFVDKNREEPEKIK